jgi:hypothetical protein
MTARRVRATLALGATATALVTVLVLVLVGATATPASAHGLGGLTPTNYETQLQPVTPHVDGLRVSVSDLGTKVELTNDGAREVVVLGYAGEPYLRIGRHGVFENTRSPATYLNRSTTIIAAPPKRADAKATPVWREISTGNSTRWHDHRAHYMGTDDPPAVARHPDRRRVIDHFSLPMRVGNEKVVARGRIVYVPPPSPWPWVIGAVVLAGVVFALSRTKRWPLVFVVALAVLTASEIVHVIGLWDASSATFGTKLGESIYSMAGIALGLLTLWWIWRKGAESAVPLVLVASLFLFVAGGLADVTTLGKSQLPSTLPGDLARLLVTLTLGLGAGLGAAAALRLRPVAGAPGRRRRPPPRRRAPVGSTPTS